MKTTPKPQLPFGHPSTLRDSPGGFPCRGFEQNKLGIGSHQFLLTPEQSVWMKRIK